MLKNAALRHRVVEAATAVTQPKKRFPDGTDGTPSVWQVTPLDLSRRPEGGRGRGKES